MGCAIVAFAAVAQEYDPVIASIDEARQQAKESMKKNKSLGNEMVTTVNYTVRGQGGFLDHLTGKHGGFPSLKKRLWITGTSR